MNGWAVAFWLAATVAGAALIAVYVEDVARRDEQHQAAFLRRWIKKEFKGSLNSPYETERRRGL